MKLGLGKQGSGVFLLLFAFGSQSIPVSLLEGTKEARVGRVEEGREESDLMAVLLGIPSCPLA